MSQVTGSPFMSETMLRTGVPPHIGQSPLGPAARVRGAASRQAERAAAARANERKRLVDTGKAPPHWFAVTLMLSKKISADASA